MFLEFYGLKEQPFGVTPDPRFICPSQTHSKAFNSLCHGLEAGCGFLALIAKPGMGKTTLVFQLLKQLERTSRTAFLFQTECDSRELFQYILHDLDIDAQGMSLVAMHNKLNEVLFDTMFSGKRFVLVVDEAQNLDDSVLETVRMLSNFETPKTKLMQIVLTGQTQLADKLSSPSLAQLRQRISMLCRLEPLAREEIIRYIEHRLQVAGHVGAPLFTGEALEKIAAHSEGIPRNINNLCFNSLLLGYAAGSKQVESATVAQVLDDLEMNPPESKRAAAQREPQPLPQPPVTRYPHMFKADVDPKQGDSNGAREIVIEFETTSLKPAPQTPQGQAPPQPQRAVTSPADVAPDEFSHSKVDSENGHERVSLFGADPPPWKPSVTRAVASRLELQTDPNTTLGDFSGRMQNGTSGVDISYPVTSRGLGRWVLGTSTLVAVLLLAGLSVFHSRVGASLQSQDPLGAAAAPALTPQPTPEVSSRSAAPSTSATSPLAPDKPLSQSFLTPTTGPKIERIVIDPGHRGDDASTTGCTTRVADSKEGDANTEFALGVRYALGTGVLRDDRQAFSLFQKAAEQGNVSAQSALATSYWLGCGIRENNVEAYSWATIAHERGDPPSGELLKVLASTMSQTELSEGTRKAQEWERKHSAR